MHLFVPLFYSSPSKYLWEDDEGVRHTIHQGEGGEQGDALMPLLFCVGQHAAHEAIQRGLNPDEKLFAFLDDLHLVSKPERVGVLHNLAQREFGFTEGKPTFGTKQDKSQRHVTGCRE